MTPADGTRRNGPTTRPSSASVLALGALLLALGALLLAPAVAAAVTGPRGNAEAIAFERAAYKAVNASTRYAVVEQGSVSYFAQHTSSATVTHVGFSWNTGVVATGWAPATAQVSFGLKKGTITWIFAVLNPPQGNPNMDVQVFIDGSGTFYTVVDTTASFPGLCYRTWTGTTGDRTPWTGTVGHPLFVLEGDFKGPPKTETVHGTRYTYVTYSFEFGTYKQIATERDGFDSKTKAATTSVIHYAAKGPTHPAFTVTQTWIPKGLEPKPTFSTCP